MMRWLPDIGMWSKPSETQDETIAKWNWDYAIEVFLGVALGGTVSNLNKFRRDP